MITFDDIVKDALQLLDDGDSVALTGALTPKVWTDKQGNVKPALDLVAHAVLTTYHADDKRRAMRGESGESGESEAPDHDDL